ncbi:MAG: BON domain-containing protein [Gammaproteobacteria bacterium]
MKAISLTALLMTAVLSTGCVIVVDGTEDSPDAHWIGDFETNVEVRRESNEELATRVSDRLAAEAALGNEDISVSASNRVVTLHGRLNDVASLEQAVDIAGEVEGVDRVVSRITLDVRGS